MYNLLVAGKEEAWEGSPYVFETSRCVREDEYTGSEMTRRYGTLDAEAVSELRRLPCIFAYESRCKKPPKFGFIREISRLQDQVRVEYEISKVEPFLSYEDLEPVLEVSAFELGIHDSWEMGTTHWAVKDVNLVERLSARGISLPPRADV